MKTPLISAGREDLIASVSTNGAPRRAGGAFAWPWGFVSGSWVRCELLRKASPASPSASKADDDLLGGPSPAASGIGRASGCTAQSSEDDLLAAPSPSGNPPKMSS